MSSNLHLLLLQSYYKRAAALGVRPPRLPSGSKPRNARAAAANVAAMLMAQVKPLLVPEEGVDVGFRLRTDVSSVANSGMGVFVESICAG